VRTLLLDVGCRHDLGGYVEPFSEVVEAFRGEGVVVPLPGELGFEVAAGGQGLACFDDLGSFISTCDFGSYGLPSYLKSSRIDSWCQALGVWGG
jgi:hypothetical protein